MLPGAPILVLLDVDLTTPVSEFIFLRRVAAREAPAQADTDTTSLRRPQSEVGRLCPGISANVPWSLRAVFVGLAQDTAGVMLRESDQRQDPPRVGRGVRHENN